MITGEPGDEWRLPPGFEVDRAQQKQRSRWIDSSDDVVDVAVGTCTKLGVDGLDRLC